MAEGAVPPSVGLPDLHSGYGFAIGNMAAFDMEDPLVLHLHLQLHLQLHLHLRRWSPLEELALTLTVA